MNVNDDNSYPPLLQGSLKIYKYPLPDDIEDTTLTGGDPSLGQFQGLPGNDPIKVLVRIYVVKVNKCFTTTLRNCCDFSRSYLPYSRISQHFQNETEIMVKLIQTNLQLRVY